MEKDKIDISQESVLQLKLRLEKLLEIGSINIDEYSEHTIDETYKKIQKSIKQKKQQTPIVDDDEFESELLHYGLDDEIEHENKSSDTRNEVDMKELEKAIQLVSDARKILDSLLDKKLSEHSVYYYHKEKGIGFRVLDDLKLNRDKLLISTLINNLQKMI